MCFQTKITDDMDAKLARAQRFGLPVGVAGVIHGSSTSGDADAKVKRAQRWVSTFILTCMDCMLISYTRASWLW